METPNLPAIRALRPAWNKGRIVGQKRPLKPKHVWAIRVRLELAENHRDLALFNLAIDSKLRGCDLVKMKVVDVMASGQTALGSELLICAAGLTLEVSGAGTPLRRWVVQKGERKSPFWSGFTGAQNALVPMGAGRANSPASGKPAIRFMVEQGSMPRLAIGRMGCNGKRAAGFPCRSLACEAEKRMPL